MLRCKGLLSSLGLEGLIHGLWGTEEDDIMIYCTVVAGGIKVQVGTGRDLCI